MPNRLRSPWVFLGVALGIELLDELVDGVTGAAWPLVRSDLGLSYIELGLLLGVPAILANIIEPGLGLLADFGHRRALVLGGGALFAASLALFAGAGSFWPLLAAQVLFYPASGAFVALTQTALMDADPTRREHNMARWALAGSVGNVAGPLLIGAAVALGLGWRAVYALLAVLAVAALVCAWKWGTTLGHASRPNEAPDGAKPSWRMAARDIWGALRRGEVRRFLILLECANLMMDVLRGFVALYFVGAAHTSEVTAGLAVAVLTAVGLVGDALVLPLLERVSGTAYLRASALVAAIVFPAFLLAPQIGAKLVLLGVLGLLTSGWYAILQAGLYGSLPQRSGTVMALGSFAGMAGGLVPLLLGGVAQRFGIGAAMWLLLAGPLALLAGLRAGTGTLLYSDAD